MASVSAGGGVLEHQNVSHGGKYLAITTYGVVRDRYCVEDSSPKLRTSGTSIRGLVSMRWRVAYQSLAPDRCLFS